MQKAVLGRPYFLILHLTEQKIIVATADRATIHAQATLATSDANRLLIPTIDTVLTSSNVHFCNLSAISASTGPGQFIVLRALLVTANGLAYATGLPLIGLPMLEVGAHALHTTPFHATCWIQRAHRGEVCLYWYEPDAPPSPLVTLPTSGFRAWLHEHHPHVGSVQWAGNAVPELTRELGLATPQPIVTEVTLDMTHHATVSSWDAGAISNSLIPIYNRSATFGRYE